jgi:polyphosphate kinase
LIVAPMHMRGELVRLIRSQAREGGMITIKMNALVDSEMIDELYAASNAGARIDLIVRSICCLRAGIPGLSEHITVRSIVGRHLEHSRIFRFGIPGDDATEYVIGSADLMPRNLDRRVEADLRVVDTRMRARLDEILEIEFADDVLAWTLEPDGTWRKVPTVVGLDCQVKFQELAVARAKVRPAES